MQRCYGNHNVFPDFLNLSTTSGLSILLHEVVILTVATSYDNYVIFHLMICKIYRLNRVIKMGLLAFSVITIQSYIGVFGNECSYEDL